MTDGNLLLSSLDECRRKLYRMHEECDDLAHQLVNRCNDLLKDNQDDVQHTLYYLRTVRAVQADICSIQERTAALRNSSTIQSIKWYDKLGSEIVQLEQELATKQEELQAMQAASPVLERLLQCLPPQ